MGEIIQLHDGLYKYELPTMPSDEKDILFFDKKKSEQKWVTPFIEDIRRMPERQKIEYINLHRERWANGVWFFNKGEPTYITGIHYDFLTFCHFEDFGARADYLDQQRLDFYFRDLVRKDTTCYGSVILKCRRCGMTSQEICESIYTLLEDFNCKIGYQSNELKNKCLPELMQPTINVYMKRPKWMRERHYAPNGKRPTSILKLSPTVQNDDDWDSDDNSSDWLGGNIRPYQTIVSAMDGSKKRYIVMDEVWKWPAGISPSDTLHINKKCIVQYGIKGKVSMLSTMGDSDSLAASIKEGCEIWGQSNPNVRDKNGRTTTGLYKWFVSGIHSADIPEEHRDVKYGFVNKEKAEEYIWNEVNKHSKNSKNYVFELRRLPIIEEHALMSASEKSYFNLIRIEQRLKELYDLPIDAKPYVRGNLVEDKNDKVWFEENEEGLWLIAIHPYFSSEKNIDTRNRFRNINGVLFPPINPEFCAGYDPVRYKTDNTVSRHLSQASGVMYKKFDYFNSGVINQYCALLLFRPDNPEYAHYEMAKACKYYGAPCMIERQVETTETEFEKRNMIPFLMKSEDDNKIGIWTNPKRTESGLQMLVTRFSVSKEQSDIDQLETYPFEAGLEDKKSFDLTNTTESHVTMSEIMLEYGLKQMTFTNLSDETVNKMSNIIMEIIPPRRRAV